MTEENENESGQIAEMKIRLPVKLRIKIEDAARLNRRKMNAEIVARLEAAFTNNDADAPATTWEVAQLRDDLTKLQVEVATLKGDLKKI